jgi:Rhs element Vgr protein
VRHGVRAPQGKPSVLRVECRDAAVKLVVGRKCAYFYDMKDAEIIEKIAGAAGLQTDVEATAVTHPQMVQFHASDWDFVLSRAEANGKLVLTRDGKLAVKAPPSGGAAALTLTYGGNLLEFEAVMDARTQVAAVKSLAWGAANQEMTETEAGAAGATSPGNLSSDDLAQVIGLDALVLRHGGQLKDGELQAWADGERARAGFAKVRGRARIQGYAGIAPGDLVELRGVGERFNGTALVTGVRHELGTRNWETDLEFGLAPETLAERERDLAAPGAAGLLPPVAGLHIGLVTALEGDPDGEERIQVCMPLVEPGSEGVWARLATLDAGENRGSVFRPEIGDEVVLGFLNDDPRHPVVLGQLHSSAKPAPIPAADANPEKGFVTRAEIKLLFDDENKVLTIETPNGNTVVLSDADGGISLKDENGNKLVMDSGGITLESAADVKIKATGDVKIEGANVTTSASTQLKAEGSAGAEITSSGTMVVKGSLVQIN